MPVCWISGCSFTPGRIHNGGEIKLHCFPYSLDRIREWLQNMGQQFHDLEGLAQNVFENKKKKYNKYRLCSIHFTDDSFIVNASGRILRPNAVPTVFPKASASTPVVREDLAMEKIRKKRRKIQPLESPQYSIPPQETELHPFSSTFCSSLIKIIKCEPEDVAANTFREVETQTDFTLENCVILSHEDYQHPIHENVFEQQSPSVYSTQGHLKKMQVFKRGFHQSIKQEPNCTFWTD